MWRFIRLISTKTNIKTPITLRYDKNQYKINKLTINIIPFNNIRFILLYVLRVFFSSFTRFGDFLSIRFSWYRITICFLSPKQQLALCWGWMGNWTKEITSRILENRFFIVTNTDVGDVRSKRLKGYNIWVIYKKLLG